MYVVLFTSCPQNEKLLFAIKLKKQNYYIFAIQLIIYIIYGDRTIIAIIICDVRRRIRHLFITFAIAMD
jgi:hypothetical protein